MTTEAERKLAYIAKRIPSRSKIEELRAYALLQDDETVQTIADNLLLIRQELRGGKLNPPDRYWPDDDMQGDTQ